MTTPHPTDNRLELLAPAKTAAIGREAIEHGADAVYIGGPAFGARTTAGNPVQDIAALAVFAHRYHARVFVTLNTILHDDELETAQRLVIQLYDAGVDALIIQDVGLLELALPPLALHASTQCDIRSAAKARFLGDVGLSQLVLARELSLAQIGAIHAATDARLEFFVHGALCVAYSGQCYLSHARTGRSGNRGDCSQPCRLPYTLTDAQGRIIASDKHLLSLKDNNQSANLRALIDAGIRSFKIEGRYKDAAYVKNITAHYRLLLDEILEERPHLACSSSGRSTFAFRPDPAKTFNRGATDYFVNGRRDDIDCFATPAFMGAKCGAVISVGQVWFDLESEQELHNGDGLSYLVRGEVRGTLVNRVERIRESWRVYPNECAALEELSPGTLVYRNRDHEFERLLLKSSSDRRVAVDLALQQTAAGLALCMLDEDGCSVTAEVSGSFEAAQQPERAEASLRAQLTKLGNTMFSARQVELRMREVPFVPVSVVNGLRREAVERLETARLAAFARPSKRVAVEPPSRYPGDTLSYLGNVYNAMAREFYRRHGVERIDAAYEAHQELGEVALMTMKQCLRYAFGMCPKAPEALRSSAEPLVLVNGNDRFTLTFDCKACEMQVRGRIRKAVWQPAGRRS